MTTQDQNNERGRRFSVPAASTLPPLADWRLNATDIAVLISCFKIQVKGNKHYCVPSVDALRALLEKYHGIYIKRRACFRSLQRLAAKGFIGRKRRWKLLPGNIVRSLSGIITLTFNATNWLTSKSVEGAKELKAKMIAWLHRGDKRFPGPSNIFPGEEITERSTALARLKELVKPIGSGPAGGITPATT